MLSPRFFLPCFRSTRVLDNSSARPGAVSLRSAPFATAASPNADGAAWGPTPNGERLVAASPPTRTSLRLRMVKKGWRCGAMDFRYLSPHPLSVSHVS